MEFKIRESRRGGKKMGMKNVYEKSKIVIGTRFSSFLGMPIIATCGFVKGSF